MKDKTTRLVLAISALAVAVLSCETQKETFDQFTDEGETIYIGRPDTIISAPLNVNMTRFFVKLNSDPKISKGKIVDLDGNTVKEFAVDRSTLVDDIVEVDLDLDEGDYSYRFVMEDAEGNTSVPREVVFRVFGDNYRQALLPRTIQSVIATSEGTRVVWDSPPVGSLFTTLAFEDTSGMAQTLEVPNSEGETVLEDHRPGTPITYSANYMPTDNALVSFSSRESMQTEFIMDYSAISALRLPGDATDGCYGSSYERLTNGSTGEFWHSCEGETDTDDLYPWVMSFDLGQAALLSSFRLDERSGCCGDRSPGAFQIWATNSLDGGDTANIDAGTVADWEADATAKGWTKILDVTGNTSATIEAVMSDNMTSYRYVRVVGISSIGGGNVANFDEFTFRAMGLE